MSFVKLHKDLSGISIGFFAPKKQKEDICWIPHTHEVSQNEVFELKMGKLKKKKVVKNTKEPKYTDLVSNKKKKKGGDHCWTHYQDKIESHELYEVKMGHLKKKLNSLMMMFNDTESTLSTEEKYEIIKDVIESEIVQISWEATPSTDIPLLGHISKAGFLEQKKYLQAIMSALETTEDGDAISRKLGINTKKIMIGYSAWQGNVGAGAQTFAEVDVERDGLNIDVVPNHKKLLNLYSAIMGFLLRQDAVIWYFKNHNIIPNQEQVGIEAKFHFGLNASEFREAYNAIYLEFQTWNLAPGFTNDGFIVVNYDDKIDNETFQEGMKKVFSNLRKNKIGKGLRTKKMFKFVGEYIGNDWVNFPEGEKYFEAIGDEELWKWVLDMKSRIDKVNQEFEDSFRESIQEIRGDN